MIFWAVHDQVRLRIVRFLNYSKNPLEDETKNKKIGVESSEGYDTMQEVLRNSDFRMNYIFDDEYFLEQFAFKKILEIQAENWEELPEVILRNHAELML